MDLNEKLQIRKDILFLRNHLSEDIIFRAEEKIFSKLLFLPLKQNLANSKNIMFYMDFKNEVPTRKIMDYILLTNKTAILPSTKSGKILSYKVTSMNHLQKDAYGILSPDPEVCPLVDPKDIDLILIPGVAFDLSGNRLGFGKGYYDRFLPLLSHQVPKVALAYDFQIVEKIPIDEFDVPMDYILTPEQTLTFT